MSYVEKSKILIDMGEGLLSRLYFYIRKLKTNDKAPVLVSKEFSRVRTKAEKSFPEIPEFTKIQGGDTFLVQAAAIKASLDIYDDLIVDLVEFTSTTVKVLQEMPRDLVEVKFERNQQLSLYFMDLMVCYIRVMLLFSSMAERKMIYAVFTAAAAMASLPKSTFWNDAITLFAKTDQLVRHFIDTFGPIIKHIRPILLQVKPALSFAENCETLRNSYFFNPINEGVKMGMPATGTINSNVKLNPYSELLNLKRYTDYVALITLACPPLLYDDFCYELFKQVTSGILFVEIYRDVSLSIHDEFEKLLTMFPSRQDKETYKKPHGYKLKNKLRDIAKVANKDVALRLRTRRSFITSELSNLRNILLISPGLIGPKYPMVLAACAYAKFECINYFLHIDKADMIRRDCRRLYVPEKFVSPSITTLLYELVEMAKLIRKYRCIVISYQSEFIHKNDVLFLDPVCQQLSSKYSLLKPLMDYCLNAMKSLNTDAIQNWTDTSLVILRDTNLPTTFDEDSKQMNGKYYSDYSGSEVSLFDGLRLNVDRILMMMSTNTMPCFASDPYLSDQFTSRISAVYQRSYSIDAIDQQINSIILPFECYWFRSHFLVAQTNALTYQGKQPYTEQSLVYLYLTKYSVLSAHSDNVEEHERLHETVYSTCQIMIQSITKHIVNQVEFIAEVTKTLDSEIRPIEAGNRLQKILDAKKRRTAEPIQFLPGNESLLWAKDSMSTYKAARSNLNILIGAINNNRFFEIRNKYYDLHVTIMKNMYNVLESKFQNLFFPNESSTSIIERSSYGRGRMLSLCGALQSSLSCLSYSTNFIELFRETLFRQLIDTSVPYPGMVIPYNVTIPYLIQNEISTKDMRGKTIQIAINRQEMPLVWRIATYFEALIDSMSSRSKQSSHVYVEKLKSIIPLSTGRNNSITSSDIDTKLNFDDLRQLCMLIGPQGVRAVDTHLLQLISAKVWKLSTFLVTNKSFLNLIRDDYIAGIKSASQVKNFDELENVLIYVGMCINVRSMIHRALGESMELVAPSMCVTLQAIRNSVLSEENITAFGPINTVCADLGFLAPLDIPLIQSLSPVFITQTTENIWKLFPIAAASIFISDKWESAHYVFAYDVYDKNEHCIMIAVAKLLMCMSTIPSILDPQVLNITSGKRLFQILPESFLRLSSQILLQLRLMENTSGYTNRPLRSMMLLLESFVQYTSFMDQKYLESCIPYSILHSCRMDVSLGRNKYNDTLVPFAKSRRDNQFVALGGDKDQSDQTSGQHN